MTHKSNNNFINIILLILIVGILVIVLAFLAAQGVFRSGEIVGDDFTVVGTIVIDGDLYHVYASAETTESGCNYFYSGVDQTQEIVIELDGGSFVANGDGFEVGTTTYGTLGNTDDALIFADTPGIYRFTAYDFRICITRHLERALADRRNLQQPERYVEYQILPN